MRSGGAGGRRFRAWGLLVVAGLVAGVVGLASLPNSAEGQANTVNPPTGLTFSSTTDSTTVFSWTAGAKGKCPSTYYNIDVMLDGTYNVAWERNRLKKTTVTVTGLSAGVAYRAYIRAYSNKCNRWSTEPSAPFTTTTAAATTTATATPTATPEPAAAKPNPPTGLTVSSTTDSTAVLSWKAGAKGNCPTTQYNIDVLIFGTNTIIWERDRVKKKTVTVTGLSAGTKYQAEVLAYGNSCDSYAARVNAAFTTSTATATSTPTPEPTATGKPNAPTGFSASSITETGATLSWTAGAAGNCAATKYYIDIVKFATEPVIWERDDVTATTLTVTGLSRATVYQADIKAYGDDCDTYSPVALMTFTTTGDPAKPAGVTATGGVTQATLSWTDPSDSTITSWEYQQKAGNGSYGLWTAIPSSSATTANHIVTGLTAGTTYAFKVRAVNPAGNSPASDEVTATTAPAKPTSVTATGGVRRVTLSWTDPGDSTITSWEYQQKAGNGSYGLWTAIPSSSATTANHIVTGLTAGTTYAFKVRAVNPAGNSPASDEVTAATAPAKPTRVAADGGLKQVTLSWTDPRYASITSWEYQQKAGSGNYGLWMAIPGSSATTISHIVTGLADGTVYAFKVRAVNPGGNGVASDEVTATTHPSKPTGVTATGGTRQVTLSWTDPSEATITHWEYQRKTGTGSYGSWIAIPGSSATTTTYTVTGLSDSTTYAFRVWAVNPTRWGPASDEVTAMTVPAKPAGASATAGAQRVILAWADPGDATITRWEYQQKQGGGSYGSWTPIPGSGATTTTYTVRGLLAETAYGFRVRAVNGGGNGPALDEMTATTPMFVLVPGETTATPVAGAGATPTGTPTPTPTPTPTATPTPGATPAPGSTPTPTPPPSATPDTGAGDTDDDEPPEPDTGDGDRDDEEPAEPDTGAGDRDDDEPTEPDMGDGDRDDDGDVAGDEPGIGDTGSGLAPGAGVSLAAVAGMIALALALTLGGPAWARRRR